MSSKPPIEFAYRATDQSLLDSAHTRGRATALLFVTTYDWASPIQARRLGDVVRRQRPRVNAGAIVLETDEYRMMAEVFHSSLRLPYPIALADERTRNGEGPFGPIPIVPTLVILDREGRELWRQSGLVEAKEIHDVLTRAARSGSASPELPAGEGP